MGWLFYNSTFIKPNGEVDRKKEIQSGFNEGYTVVKSIMVGRVYYGAIKNEATNEVFGYIVLTSSDKKGGFNFGYKSMDETCGPVECKCPLSILNLLSPTDNQWANEWRERCREYHREQKSNNSFANLPIGTKVIWTIPHEHFTRGKKGEKVELVKHKERGRRACWVNWASYYRVNPKYVNMRDVVIQGAA